MKVTKISAVVLLCVIALFSWLIAAMNYDDSVAVGQYSITEGEIKCDLVLLANHTFVEHLYQSSRSTKAEGTWRRIGEGGVDFSNDFLPLRGTETSPDGSSYAVIDKTLGLFVSLQFAAHWVYSYSRDDAASSTLGLTAYTSDETSTQQRVILDQNHTFHQTVLRDGSTKASTGTWTRDASGEIEFSRQYLKASGEPLTQDETAVTFNSQGGGLQIIVQNTHRPQPVILRKVFFR